MRCGASGGGERLQRGHDHLGEPDQQLGFFLEAVALDRGRRVGLAVMLSAARSISTICAIAPSKLVAGVWVIARRERARDRGSHPRWPGLRAHKLICLPGERRRGMFAYSLGVFFS